MIGLRFGVALGCFALLFLALAPIPGAAVQHPSDISVSQASKATIKLDPAQSTTGAKVTVVGLSFVGNEKVLLLWQTVVGNTTVIGGYMYGGHRFQNRTVQLAEVIADASGGFTSSIVIPYDYGGYHQVLAQGSSGSTASFTFYVVPQLTMSPSTGPVGTKIGFTGSGFGWTVGLDDAWQIDYDNKYVGYFMAIKSKGNVSFSIRASGDQGLHVIDVFANPYGPTYLNLQEAFPEFARLPRFQFDFELTQGQPSAPTSEVSGEWNPAVATTGTTQGQTVSVDPSSGVVGSTVNISGSSFAGGEDVNLSWTSVRGAYINPSGFANTTVNISTIKADSAGRFELQYKIPYDVGGIHIIQARGSLGHASNSTFYLTRSAVMSPTSGPPGTKITIHVYGVGWRSWENIAAVDYDNAYTGYGCALGTQPGNITIFLTAVGAPGLHTIDLYPSIFRGPLTINYRTQGGTEPDIYRFPLLTPNELPEPLPTFHFEFIITGQSGSAATGFNGIQYLGLLIPVAAVILAIRYRSKITSR